MLFVVYLCLYGLVGLYLVSRGAALFGLPLPVMRREILGFRSSKTGFLREDGSPDRYFFLRMTTGLLPPLGLGVFSRKRGRTEGERNRPLPKKKRIAKERRAIRAG